MGKLLMLSKEQVLKDIILRETQHFKVVWGIVQSLLYSSEQLVYAYFPQSL